LEYALWKVSSKQAPGKTTALSMLNFSQFHHHTHREKKKLQGASVNRKAAIITVAKEPVTFFVVTTVFNLGLCLSGNVAGTAGGEGKYKIEYLISFI
jgi:hypothetical protein